ncbi:MAG: hypothetical protein ABSG81_06340 [Acidimicrobiales bacterium]|jgi:TolB protein
MRRGATVALLMVAAVVLAACTTPRTAHAPRSTTVPTATGGAGSAAQSARAAASTGTTVATPPAPPAPGRLEADGLAWRGHGALAFVSDNQLYVLDDNGVLTRIVGPSGGAYDDPTWSGDGQWLAFAYDVAPTQLPEGLPDQDEPADDTLWLVHAGDTTAHQVAPMDIGQFAWAPVGPPLLAFETLTFDALSQSLWTDVPGHAATAVPGLSVEAGGFAWSPDATHFAIVAGTNPTPGGPAPTAQLQVIPVSGGPAVTWYATTGNSIDLDGWWPDGGGILFWLDVGSSSSVASDGLTLYSQGRGASPRALATTLVNTSWVVPSPTGDTVAVVAGGDRFVWGGGKNVETCGLATAVCTPVTRSGGTVTLSPAWASSRQLSYIVASASGPFAKDGPADFSPGWMAQWDATNRLDLSGSQGPTSLSAAGSGVVDVVWNDAGTGLLLVRDDALWWEPSSSSAPARVAGPLYSTAAPSGYYGQVAWPSMFAWYSGAGASAG